MARDADVRKKIAEVEDAAWALTDEDLSWIRKRWIRWLPLVTILLGFLIIIGGVVIGGLVYSSAELPRSVVVALIGVLITFIGATFLVFHKSATAQARGYFNEQESRKEGPEERARLKIQYYTHENLRQVRWIFWLSLVAMFLGFLIIIGGAILAFKLANENPDTTQVSSIVAIVTSLSGVIVEFIAATFLFVYRSTMKQASQYVDVLMRLNIIGMSIKLVNEIEDNDIVGNNGDHTFQNETRARIASEILSQSGLEKAYQNTRE